ncbi:MAG: hypothetical protein RL748_1602, partial [Pseudomonadota bacterium]
ATATPAATEQQAAQGNGHGGKVRAGGSDGHHGLACVGDVG